MHWWTACLLKDLSQGFLRGCSVNPALSSCQFYLPSTQQGPQTPSCSVDFSAKVSITSPLPHTFYLNSCQSPVLTPFILSVYLVLLLCIPCRDLTHVLILNGIHPFLVHRFLLPEESGRCNYSKQSQSSDKTPCTGQGLKIIKPASSESRMMSRVRGNLESRQGDYAVGKLKAQTKN